VVALITYIIQLICDLIFMAVFAELPLSVCL
jgi:hypothetical protein